MIEQTPTLSRFPIIQMTSMTMKCPALDDRDHSTGGIGGLQGVWLGEGSTLNPDTVIHRAIELTAHKHG